MKYVVVLVAKSCPTLLRPHGLSPARLPCPRDSQGLLYLHWQVGSLPLAPPGNHHQYWSVLPFPTPGNLPDPGIKPPSPALAGGFFTAEPPTKPLNQLYFNKI